MNECQINLVPCYEEKRFIDFADKMAVTVNYEEKEGMFFRLWDELVTGFSMDASFITPEQAIRLKKHIPGEFFRNDMIVKLLNYSVLKGWGENIYSEVLLLKDGFRIECIEINPERREDKIFYDWYMSKRIRYSDHGLVSRFKKEFYLQECIVMWGINIVTDYEKQNTDSGSLSPGEQYILNFGNETLVLLSLKKGFLKNGHIREYIHYTMELGEEVYRRIVPIFMLADEETQRKENLGYERETD